MNKESRGIILYFLILLCVIAPVVTNFMWNVWYYWSDNWSAWKVIISGLQIIGGFTALQMLGRNFNE